MPEETPVTNATFIEIISRFISWSPCDVVDQSEVESEVGTVVQIDDVFDHADIEGGVARDVNARAQRDFVGPAGERTRFSNRCVEEVLSDESGARSHWLRRRNEESLLNPAHAQRADVRVCEARQ